MLTIKPIRLNHSRFSLKDLYNMQNFTPIPIACVH